MMKELIGQRLYCAEMLTVLCCAETAAYDRMRWRLIVLRLLNVLISQRLCCPAMPNELMGRLLTRVDVVITNVVSLSC